MNLKWLLRHKIIGGVILLLLLPAILIVNQSAAIEENNKQILLTELDHVFNRNDLAYKLISGHIGEGNDAYFEYHFEVEIVPLKSTEINYKAFRVRLEPQQSYVINGISGFEGGWFDRHWRMIKLELTALKTGPNQR